jgi:hypothetical protein
MIVPFFQGFLADVSGFQPSIVDHACCASNLIIIIQRQDYTQDS